MEGFEHRRRHEVPESEYVRGPSGYENDPEAVSPPPAYYGHEGYRPGTRVGSEYYGRGYYPAIGYERYGWERPGGYFAPETYRERVIPVRGPGAGYYGEGLGERGFRGRGPRGYQRSNERIREDVCERLTDHPAIDATDVEVDAREGVVTLQGSVEDRRQKRLADDVAESVSGVRDVNNQLEVRKGMLDELKDRVGLSEEQTERTPG